MIINLIAAIGRSGQIGLNGSLPWHDAKDLAWFKSVTVGKTLIVGANTLLTLPVLPSRTVMEDNRNVSPEDFLRDNCEGLSEVFIIGGAKTYARWMHLVDRFYLGRINYNGPADTYMPPLPFTCETHHERT